MDYVTTIGFWYHFSLWFTQLCIGLFTSAYGVHMMIEESRTSSLTAEDSK